MKKKTARWIRRTHIFRRDEYECTACGCYTDKPYVICPNCGTPMKGAKYDAGWVDEIEAMDAMGDEW